MRPIRLKLTMIKFYITNQIKNPVKQVLELQYDSTQKEELKKLDEIFN